MMLQRATWYYRSRKDEQAALRMRIKEIAAVTGVSEGTVKSRLFRGMVHLHELLDEQPSGDQT